MFLLLDSATGLAATKSEAEDPVNPFNSQSYRGNWSFSLGGGVGIRPEYDGSDKVRASFMPFVQVTYRNWLFINPAGLVVTAYQNDALRLGVTLQLAPGRKESQSADLTGLGDIGIGVRPGAFASYLLGPLRFNASVSKDIGSTKGLLAQGGVGLFYPVAPHVRLVADTSVSWANEAYEQALFGITQTQSLASGLPVYTPSGGIQRADLRVGAIWDFSTHWSARLSGGEGILLGNAGDSPITKQKSQPMLSVGTSYRF